jgi:hypothetical protein
MNLDTSLLVVHADIGAARLKSWGKARAWFSCAVGSSPPVSPSPAYVPPIPRRPLNTFSIKLLILIKLNSPKPLDFLSILVGPVIP